jgi:2-haloacid dehalogenase
MQAAPIRAVCLDVNETALNISALIPAFEAVGLGAADLRLWFARTQRDGFALCAAGSWASFWDIAAANFLALAPDRITESNVEELLHHLRQCPVHADVAPGIAELQEAGLQVGTLTIGNAQLVRSIFERSAITLAHHLSCDEVQRWKPAPEPYVFAATQFGVPVEEMLMVAAHDWDLAGAKAVGMQTAYLDRGLGFSPVFPAPDYSGTSLGDIARQIP